MSESANRAPEVERENYAIELVTLVAVMRMWHRFLWLWSSEFCTNFEISVCLTRLLKRSKSPTKQSRRHFTKMTKLPTEESGALVLYMHAEDLSHGIKYMHTEG